MTRYLLAAASEILGTDRFVVAGEVVFLGSIGVHPQPLSPQTAQRVRDRAVELEMAEEAANARRAEFPNLEPDQFWFIVRVSGHEQDLRDWLETLDPVTRAAASSKLQFAKFFERDHPFVESAREALGIPSEQLDALWAYGAAS